MFCLPKTAWPPTFMLSRKCQKNHKETITTGPFLVPRLTSNGGPNNKLVIIIKNPTKETLEADLSIEACIPPSSPPIGTPQESDEVTVSEGFTMTPIGPERCLRLEVDLAPFDNHALRVSSTGNYEAGKDRPKCGKLEITVTGGTGFFGGSSFGLIIADPTLFFGFGDFVVCEEQHEKIRYTN